MTDVKPHVGPDDVASLVAQHLGGPVRNVRPVEGGNVARTYSCTVGEREYIVRINRQMGANFEKEAVIRRMLAATNVPIPRIVHIGRFGDLNYAISEKAEGRRLDTLPPGDVAAVLPAMIETLGAIHAVDTTATSGFGAFGDDGRGLFPSWRAFLEAIREEEPEGEFYGRWHAMFDSTFLERDLVDRIFERMMRRINRCPEDRSLLHGDYGFGNILVRDGRITAVLDWLNAMYGDVVYDVAWLDFWAVGAELAAVFHDHYLSTGVSVVHYDDRVRCYQDYIGLDALRFFAKTGDENAYRWTRDRLLSSEG